MGTGWDVAYASLFLHSNEAGFITGAVLPVDGGQLDARGRLDFANRVVRGLHQTQGRVEAQPLNCNPPL